ncbi:alanine racemase [Sporomusa malonica]|uniref:D-serine deaminase, pyridoxal phosphate-dependent n=1 Tax=Sporomusa malonica TaxID=112901 RepID=A0A1W2CSD3_9FIRM|nr:alanine racemase [Sporomusa malonica]SMC88155.1 D-serine deaminase, pyridoxal phosphate-dependent [Sporomusa malonica]
MLRTNQLTTPSFLVDLDKMELNIREMAELCKTNGKKLCPMVKTHKSTGVAALQAAHGADNFLVGTLDEAERLQQQGYQELVLAYPVAAAENIARVIDLAKRAHVILSFDGVEAAAEFEAMLLQEQIALEYLIIIDCGLHRFGVQPDIVLTLAQDLSKFSRLKFKGIATHPGHVYGKSTAAEVAAVAKAEIDALEKAADLLSNAGYAVEIVATGSTPTVPFAARSKMITTLRPGNYIFYDAIQVALGVVPPERCSLTVLATVIANPDKNLFIMDAGSKCLGLDKGAHSVSLVNGYGIIKDHPELMVESLSEEVGKIRVNGNTGIKVGDKIEIIPNHACAAANMTSFLTGHRNGICERTIAVDARGGSNMKAHSL